MQHELKRVRRTDVVVDDENPYDVAGKGGLAAFILPGLELSFLLSGTR
jgi:hypothetical protein